jgi:hypothetical protein
MVNDASFLQTENTDLRCELEDYGVDSRIGGSDRGN